jgi:hypothetical protein
MKANKVGYLTWKAESSVKRNSSEKVGGSVFAKDKKRGRMSFYIDLKTRRQKGGQRNGLRGSSPEDIIYINKVASTTSIHRALQGHLGIDFYQY